MNPPKRAVLFDVSLQADSRDDMVRALDQLAYLVARGELTRGCSGGVSSGYTYHYEERPGPTAEEYTQQLKAWLEQERSRDISERSGG